MGSKCPPTFPLCREGLWDFPGQLCGREREEAEQEEPGLGKRELVRYGFVPSLQGGLQLWDQRHHCGGPSRPRRNPHGRDRSDGTQARQGNDGSHSHSYSSAGGTRLSVIGTVCVASPSLQKLLCTGQSQGTRYVVGESEETARVFPRMYTSVMASLKEEERRKRRRGARCTTFNIPSRTTDT